MRRQPLERRSVGQCCKVEPGDRWDPVAANRQRGVTPDKAIDQAGAEESGREPGAALDQEPGDPALAERRERSGKVDLAGAVGINIDQSHAAAFFRARLVDRLVWVHAPLAIGGDGISAIAGLDLPALADAPAFERLSTETIGDDVLTTFRVRPD